jgi:hypothetical protein
MISTNYEHRSDALLPRWQFALRLLWTFLKASLLMAAALGFGVFGYHHFQKLAWIDALLEASMILGGMGPIKPPDNSSAKLFASFYALFSGIVFLSLSAVLMAPLLHRLMHRMHISEKKS